MPTCLCLYVLDGEQDQLAETTEIACRAAGDVSLLCARRCAVFSRVEPYEGLDVDQMLLEVRDPTIDPPRRPEVPLTCHPLTQALMQVLLPSLMCTSVSVDG